MVKQVIKPATSWVANASTPYADQSYKDGDRPAGDGTYTITGSGFGTKSSTGAYEDFEGEALGAYASGFDVAAGIFFINNNEFQATSCTTNNPRSGTRCLEQDFATEGFPEIYRTLSGTSTKHYFSCAVYWEGTVGVAGTVFKFGRIGANDVYDGNPKAGESWVADDGATIPEGFGGELVSSDGIIGYADNADELATPSDVYTTETWHFYELELYTGTEDGDDCWFEVRSNGDVVIRWEGLSMLTATLSDLPDWILIPANGLDEDPPITMYIDTAYSDESRARVVMTDNATYASSTQWATQPIDSYSDTSVVVTGKQQFFSTGVTAYLHLFDDDGVLVSEGNSVTVVADA